MKRDHQAIRLELEQLKSEGVIKPSDVVEFARNPETALHDCFTWDDSEAAKEFRLWEARRILQVYVKMDPADTKSVRAFVSLTTDRTQEGGGYRAIADVMSDDALRAQMLQDALKQLRNMQMRYKGLQQLAKVWAALDEAESAAKENLAA